MWVPPTEVIELLILLPGVEVCAALGPLSLLLIPFVVEIDEPPGVCVSLVAGGNGLWVCFFFPNKKDMFALRLSRRLYITKALVEVGPKHMRNCHTKQNITKQMIDELASTLLTLPSSLYSC